MYNVFNYTRIYEVPQKVMKQIFLFTKVFFFKHQFYPLQNGQLTPMETWFPLLIAALEVFFIYQSFYFIFFKHPFYSLQNSSLGQLHTDGDVVPTYGSSAASLQPVRSSACPLHSFGRLNSRNDVL